MDFGNLQAASCKLQAKSPYAQVLEEQWSNGVLSATTGYVYGDALISRTTNDTLHYYHGVCPEPVEGMRLEID